MNHETQTGVEIPREARKWAMICHIIALVGLAGNGIGFLLGPLIVWLINKEDHPYIDQQGKEAVNFQLTSFLALFVSAILCLVFIGFGLLIIIGIFMTIMPIIAAVKVNDGVDYKYPLTIRFLK